MKQRTLITTVAMGLLVIAALGVVFTRPRTREAVSDTRVMMDTSIEMRIYGSKRDLEAAFRRVQELDNLMSRTRKGSDIYRVNQEAGRSWVKVSADTFYVIETALRFAELTGGLFDPTVTPLVELWGIGTENPQIPDQEAIDRAKALIDYRNVELDQAGRRVRLTQPGMGLDLGAIGKGYAADSVAQLLRERGVKSALLNLGGNVLVIGGKPDGSPWRIGIQDPFAARGTHVTVLEVRDISIVTSGPYERFFIRNGKRYHHILNPETGYPAETGLASVSIITPASTTADALSTSVFLLGVEKGLALLEELENVEGMLITNDRKVYLTSGLKGQVKSLAKGFEFGD
ncbi:MAG TPA: FAD:protein FMN transferase [Firmicutes bacterium]|nr:FAD:protein FMN transferase [Bacillota bacterium]